MPASVEPRVGGAITQRHAPGDEGVSRGQISAYEPPHRFAYEEDWESRTVATEFLIEAQSGGSCVVRVVTHGLTADDADFTGGLISGWTQALATLRVYLATFAGRPAGSTRLWTHAEGTLDEAWSTTLRRAGLEGVAVGQYVELMHAAITINGGMVMLSDDFPEFTDGQSSTPETFGGSPVTIHLNLPDVDAVWQQAVDAGATITMPLEDQFWGDRYGQLTDPFGHRWSLATPKTTPTEDQIHGAMEQAFGTPG